MAAEIDIKTMEEYANWKATKGVVDGRAGGSAMPVEEVPEKAEIQMIAEGKEPVKVAEVQVEQPQPGKESRQAVETPRGTYVLKPGVEVPIPDPQS